MANVVIVEDSSQDMLEITVNNNEVFFGNYWDFNIPKDLIELLNTITGVHVTYKKGKLET